MTAVDGGGRLTEELFGVARARHPGLDHGPACLCRVLRKTGGRSRIGSGMTAVDGGRRLTEGFVGVARVVVIPGSTRDLPACVVFSGRQEAGPGSGPG
jgi:hypothetical protein